MSKGKIRHMFPGGNTSLGFYSFYNYILSQDVANRIFVIKGGPGTGKSSFMKKIGLKMVDRGYDVEFMHCSSDNNSLDGVVIVQPRIALIDGTAPHVVDPKNPGAVDEIIHLGDFWREDGFRENRSKLLDDNREISRYFARAYRYLKAAAAVYEDNETITSWAIDTAKVNFVISGVVNELFGFMLPALKEGVERRLFASAITPDGLKNYLSSLLTTGHVYVLKGAKGTGTERLLERVKQEALQKGYDVEAYYCPLKPDHLEHLIIPGMDVSFTTVNEYHNAGVTAYKEIDLNKYLDYDILKKYSAEINFNTSQFDTLLNIAIYTINKAKAVHDRLETYYIPNMDFDAVDRCREETLVRILDLAEKSCNNGITPP